MFNIIGTTVNTEAMSLILEQFADEMGVGPNKRIVLVWDGAGWHTSKHLRVPDGIHIVQLPAYSPELQPVECLFPLVNEALANRLHSSIEELESRLIHRLAALDQNPAIVSEHTRFHWWPCDVQASHQRVAS